jgi:membrane protease YdiL (CAAX protease family)
MTVLLGAVAVALVFFAFPPGRFELVRAITIEQWRAIDRETERSPDEAGRTSLRVMMVLVVAAIALTIQQYFGDHRTYEDWFAADTNDRYYDLMGYVWWSAWRVIGYVVVPLVALLVTGERVRDYYISPRGFGKHLWIYGLLYLAVLPAVIIASHTQQFRDTYPFYRKANRSDLDLWLWELAYGVQFVALELFFRGFLLHGLRRVLGANAIFVMVVPYCMIHYEKPMAETFGAIGAGLILGTLAMRTRSIWGGVLIHVGVAMTMDVLALAGCPPIGSGVYCGE